MMTVLRFIYCAASFCPIYLCVDLCGDVGMTIVYDEGVSIKGLFQMLEETISDNKRAKDFGISVKEQKQVIDSSLWGNR